MRKVPMKFVLLALATVGLAALLTAAPYATSDWYAAVHITVGIAYALGACGALAGVLAFRRGDRMRLAWLGVGSGAFLGLVKICIWTAPLHQTVRAAPGSTLLSILVVLTVMINVGSVWGLAIFVQSWRGTGLAPPWYGRAALAAFTIGAIIAGPSLVSDVRDSLGGRLLLGAIVSDAADIISITLMGPLVATAVWMRGGLLVWPYSLLAADITSWLLYDTGWRFAPQYGNLTDTFFASLAVLFLGAAGLAHRWVIDATKTSA